MKVTQQQLVAMCHARKIGYTELDIRRAQRYLNGPQRCMDYDRLDEWVMMLVNEWKRRVA